MMCGMRLSRCLMFAAAIAAPACATPRSRADDAFAGHRYQEAADGYAALADEAPDDTGLAGRLREARTRALVAKAGEVRAAREAGRAPVALRELAVLLEARDGWQLAGVPAVATAVAAEVAWASEHVRREIDGFVRAKRPAAARAVVASRRALLAFADFAPLWTALDATLARAGAELCGSLDGTPYLAALAAAHCAKAGIEVVPGALPHVVGGVTLDGEVAGLAGPQRAELVAALERGLAGSPWYARGAQARAAVAVDGSQRVDRSSRRVTVELPWYESVPRTAHVPAIGFGVGSGVGVIATAATMLTVVAIVPTTEYVQEERWLTYQAVRHDAEYRGDVRLAIALGPASRPVAVQVSDRIHRSGDDHDVLHDGAGLSPHRAALPTDADWSQHLIGKLETQWTAHLAAHWRTSFCEEVEYTIETAARCALGATPPPAARAALAAVLGPDIDLVLAARAR
jgi:hypothetical protein